MTDNQRWILTIIFILVAAGLAYYMKEAGIIRAYYQFWGVVP